MGQRGRGEEGCDVEYVGEGGQGVQRGSLQRVQPSGTGRTNGGTDGRTDGRGTDERSRGRGGGGREGAVPPVVCRPADKQRRYCKCIGTTRCGGFIGGFSSRREPARARLFTRSIVTGSLRGIDFIASPLSRRGATAGQRVVQGDERDARAIAIVTDRRVARSTGPSFVFFFFFGVRKTATSVVPSLSSRSDTRRRPASFMRSRAPFASFFSLFLSLPCFRPLLFVHSSATSHPAISTHSRGMMDLHTANYT